MPPSAVQDPGSPLIIHTCHTAMSSSVWKSGNLKYEVLNYEDGLNHINQFSIEENGLINRLNMVQSRVQKGGGLCNKFALDPENDV